MAFNVRHPYYFFVQKQVLSIHHTDQKHDKCRTMNIIYYVYNTNYLAFQ